MKHFATLAARSVVFTLLWLVLAGPEPFSLVYGLPGAVAAAWLSLRLTPPGSSGIRLPAALSLVPNAAYRILLGAIDVSWRALSPTPRIAPGWVLHRSRLPAGAPQLLLTCETSLFPGSLVAARQGDRLLIHCLDRTLDVASEFAREERRVAESVAAPQAGGGRA
ncbi:Na+/H+ antiporter subunit E [Aureimonas sp. SK2]|uniref:Na+/H+ antiporter subunit E n=1 Tax=Aureimonas sp. SK2 TaxID=3015992 RepID=UPI002443C7BD|nr:Na+/H+ antiporter subunit E [Aureimonas sp. SK2]